jgi:hypothetical protein
VRTTVYSNADDRYGFPALEAGTYTRIARPREFHPFVKERVDIKGAAPLAESKKLVVCIDKEGYAHRWRRKKIHCAPRPAAIGNRREPLELERDDDSKKSHPAPGWRTAESRHLPCQPMSRTEQDAPWAGGGREQSVVDLASRPGHHYPTLRSLTQECHLQ